MIRILMPLILIAALIYFLYSNGYLVMQSKRAMMFVGTKQGKKASFSGCTGYMKRIIRVSESRTYAFSLDAEIKRGSLAVEVSERSGKRIVVLNEFQPQAAADLVKGKKYILLIRFESATGQYELDWK